jgi:methyltransferase-like protein/2-polyprenyl-3-methyl-5-hydroxy-6-metoxy-1,4-benzoquinol methylase
MSTESNPRYDAIPYESHPHELSHPSCLASVATLFGMQPPALENARILELGCASGGNLLPIAQTLPSCNFFGIDSSRRQIADGQALVSGSGLSNVELRQASILDVDESYGHFDYIICHGVYSWVDGPTQQRILQLCSERLTPSGVAYISYNTYPGWRMLEMLRDMMLFHARRFEDPRRQIAQARALLEVLSKTVPQTDDPYGMLIRRECEQLRQRSDSYIYHEHLEESNSPVYFHEFVDRATAVGLQFLGEADLRSMLSDQLPEEAQAALREVATNLVYAEQYMDFFRNRTFRRTLLCRAGIPLTRKLSAQQITPFHFACALRPHTKFSTIKDNEAMHFEGPGWPSVTVSAPVAKATLLCLRESWPEHVSFAELEQRVRARLEMQTATKEWSIAYADMLWNWFRKRVVSMTIAAPRCVARPGKYPLGSAFARLQARSGSPLLTNLLHRPVRLHPIDATILTWLDGSRDREQLLALLQQEGPKHAQSAGVQTAVAAWPERLQTALDVLSEAALLCG